MLPDPNRNVTLEILADKIRILHNFGDLRWETRINGNLLVSELLTEKQANKCLEKILADGPKLNAKAFSIVKSSENPPEYRVAVRLDKLDVDETFKLSDRKQKIRLEALTAFLNQVHRPDPNTFWYVSYDNARSNYHITYGAPSMKNPLGQTMQKYGTILLSGKKVQSRMFEFSEAAKEAGFSDEIIKKFKESLTMTDDGRSCIYTFKDSKFLDALFAMSKNKKHLKFTQETTAESLQGIGIPRDIGRHASSFLGVMDAGRLAQTSKAARAKAIKTLQLEETGEKAGEEKVESESPMSKRIDESTPGQESKALKSDSDDIDSSTASTPSNDEIIYPEPEGENPAETAGIKEKKSLMPTGSEESAPAPKSNPLLFYSGGNSSTSDGDEIIDPSSDKKNEPEKKTSRKKK